MHADLLAFLATKGQYNCISVTMPFIFEDSSLRSSGLGSSTSEGCSDTDLTSNVDEQSSGSYLDLESDDGPAQGGDLPAGQNDAVPGATCSDNTIELEAAVSSAAEFFGGAGASGSLHAGLGEQCVTAVRPWQHGHWQH